MIRFALEDLVLPVRVIPPYGQDFSLGICRKELYLLTNLPERCGVMPSVPSQSPLWKEHSIGRMFFVNDSIGTLLQFLLPSLTCNPLILIAASHAFQQEDIAYISSSPSQLVSRYLRSTGLSLDLVPMLFKARLAAE
jgi:hypothetical protein